MWSEGIPPESPGDGPEGFGWDPAEPDGPWQQYADLLRRLDVVRAIEQARTEGIRVSVAQMSEHADALGEYLSDQRETLMQLARDLRYRMPDWDPIPPEQAGGSEGHRDRRPVPAPDPEREDFDADRPQRAEDVAAEEPVLAKDEHDGHDEHRPEVPPPGPRPAVKPLDPATGLSETARLIDRATDAAEKADEVGAAPAFLPHWSATSRNLLIYGLCAALAVLLQAQLRFIDPDPSIFVSYGLIPAAVFGLGYLLIRDVGAPRIGRRSRRRSVRTGLAICFIAGPVCLLLFGS